VDAGPVTDTREMALGGCTIARDPCCLKVLAACCFVHCEQGECSARSCCWAKQCICIQRCEVRAIPVAAGTLYPALGLLLRREFGPLAMSASSITVVSNALPLWRES